MRAGFGGEGEGSYTCAGGGLGSLLYSWQTAGTLAKELHQVAVVTQWPERAAAVPSVCLAVHKAAPAYLHLTHLMLLHTRAQARLLAHAQM